MLHVFEYGITFDTAHRLTCKGQCFYVCYDINACQADDVYHDDPARDYLASRSDPQRKPSALRQSRFGRVMKNRNRWSQDAVNEGFPSHIASLKGLTLAYAPCVFARFFRACARFHFVSRFIRSSFNMLNILRTALSGLSGSVLPGTFGAGNGFIPQTPPVPGENSMLTGSQCQRARCWHGASSGSNNISLHFISPSDGATRRELSHVL